VLLCDEVVWGEPVLLCDDIVRATEDRAASGVQRDEREVWAASGGQRVDRGSGRRAERRSARRSRFGRQTAVSARNEVRAGSGVQCADRGSGGERRAA
jgi:hypothetical protein